MDRTPSRAPLQARDADLGIVDGLAQLSFLIWGMVAESASRHDLSMTQIRLLGVLRDRQPGMNELATLLELDKSSVTGLVDRAEKRGLVKRTISAEDRRSFHVSLTRAGRKQVDEAADEFQARVNRTLECLSPTDRLKLSRLASQVVVARAAEHGIDLLDVTKHP